MAFDKDDMQCVYYIFIRNKVQQANRKKKQIQK